MYLLFYPPLFKYRLGTVNGRVTFFLENKNLNSKMRVAIEKCVVRPYKAP